MSTKRLECITRFFNFANKMMLQNKYGITIKSQSYEKLKTYGGQGFN